MAMLHATVAGSARAKWSMTTDALNSLEADANRLADEAVRTGGYVTAYLTGEPDAPTLVPNVAGQRLLRQLQGVRSAIALACVETDARRAVIGRRVTLQAGDGNRTSYVLVIPGQGDPASASVSADSPVGRAMYGRGIGDEVCVEAPNGAWKAVIVTIE